MQYVPLGEVATETEFVWAIWLGLAVNDERGGLERALHDSFHCFVGERA
jgi:hypothetical protein